MNDENEMAQKAIFAKLREMPETLDLVELLHGVCTSSDVLMPADVRRAARIKLNRALGVSENLPLRRHSAVDFIWADSTSRIVRDDRDEKVLAMVKTIKTQDWPEDVADWPKTANVVQGGVVPAQSYGKTRQVTVDDLVNLQERHDELLSAAKAVVERWDSPLWKDLPPTAKAIARLRDAVNKLEGRRMSKKELRLSVLEMEKLGISLVFPQCRDAEAEANSRRVVACLNACAGISTENLEDNKPIIELANDYNAVLKQRDMLLDVLRKTADDLAYVAYNIDGSKIDGLAAGLSESTCPSETALIAERNCREAIGSVKGSAA